MTAVSVIIPVFNAEKHLKKSIDSLLNQTLSDCEFIFINDGSTDDSVAIIEEFQKKDSRIKIFSQENKGVSAARNKGIQESNGDYIGFVDADDFVDAAMYQTLFEIAEKDNLDIVCSDYFQELDGKTTQIKSKFPFNTILDKEFINEKILTQFIKDSSLNSACTKLYQSEVIKDISFPVGVPLGEDGIFNLLAFNKAKKVLFTDYCGYHYVEVEGSATRSSSNKDYFKRALEVYNFDYQSLISFTLDIEKVMQWKSIRLINNVISYIHIYLQSNSTMGFLARMNYIKNMISNPIVQKAVGNYYKEINYGKSRYQQFVVNCIKNKSILKLILTSYYFQIKK
jgi:glycosyltransferase involved in cell wall biosynthesis